MYHNFLHSEAWTMFYCMSRPRFLHASIHGHLGRLRFLAVVSSAAMDMDGGRFRVRTVTASGSQETRVFCPIGKD